MTRRFNIAENILKIANAVGDSLLMSILLFISPLAAMYILWLFIRSFFMLEIFICILHTKNSLLFFKYFFLIF